MFEALPVCNHGNRTNHKDTILHVSLALNHKHTHGQYNGKINYGNLGEI